MLSALRFDVGGRAGGAPDSAFSAKSLQQGVRVEREHTSNLATAKEIAKDHLAESTDYYRDLAKMEAKEAAFVPATPRDALPAIHPVRCKPAPRRRPWPAFTTRAWNWGWKSNSASWPACRCRRPSTR